MTEEENGRWVYYGELDLEKAKKAEAAKTETVSFPEKKKGILQKLGDHRREAKQQRREEKEHKKQMKKIYREQAWKEEEKAVRIQAGRDVRARVLKPRKRGETLKKIGKGLVDLDRTLAGQPKKKRRKAGGSKIVIIQDGKVKTLSTSTIQAEEDEPEQLDAFDFLVGEQPKKKRKKKDDFDGWSILFG